MTAHEAARMGPLFVAVSLTIAPAGAHAQPARSSPAPRPPAGAAANDQRVAFDLDDADLPELVKAISNITGQRFLYGGKLRSIKATVHAGDKLSADEAYHAFLTILQANGLTVIPHGRFFKIVESAGAVGQPTEVSGSSAPVPREDRFITRIHRLAHADSAAIAAVLDKLKSKDGDVTVHHNLLFITDTGANIARLLQVIEAMDVASAERQLWVQPVHDVSPSELAGKLHEILDREGARTVRIIADDRSSSLVIAAGEPDYRRVLALIDRLDARASGEGEIRAYMLQHADCKQLSQTLNQITGAGGGGGAGRTAGSDDVFEGRVRLTCDEARNALVATANARDQGRIRATVERLDRPRRQVFLELTIMDVIIDRSRQVGVSYHAGSTLDSVNSGQALAYGGNDISTSIAGVPSNMEGLVLGLRGPDIPGSQSLLGTGVSIPSFGVVLSAVAKSGDGNVLATPHILATDNVKAEISIGQNIPLQTNVSGTSLAALAALAGSTGSGSLSSIASSTSDTQRQDVGTKISVTPHVNDSNQVRLEIAEEISEAGAPLGSLGAVPIDKRAATTTLIVRDQQTVIIGGLVRSEDTTADTSIPVLGDIPVLGHLFKQSSKTKRRTNLLLIITAHIVRDQEDLRAIFEHKMEERQKVIDRYLAFSSDQAWSPPRDWQRTSGLLEDIRQSILAAEKKRGEEAAAQPPAAKTHTPGQPIGPPAR